MQIGPKNARLSAVAVLGKGDARIFGGLVGLLLAAALLSASLPDPPLSLICLHYAAIAGLAGLAIWAQLDRQQARDDLRESQAGRQRLEISLHQTEERLHVVSDLMYDYACSYRYDSDDLDSANLEWVVGAFEDITGHSVEQALGGFSLSQPIFEEDRPVFRRRHEKLYAGQPDVSEFRILDSKQNVRWLRSYGRPQWNAELGRVERVYIGVQDITEQKQAEAALRQSEARFSTVFRNSPVPMVITRVAGKTLHYAEANDAYLRLVGYSWDELNDQSMVNIGIAIDNSQRTERIMTLYRDGQYAARDARIRNRAGEIRNVLITAQRMLFGDEAHYLEIILDVTERKKLEEQAFDLAVEKERVKVLSLFVQNASHELRTPLSVINSSTYIMTKLDSTDQRLKYAAKVKDQVDRLTQLLDNMLTMTKLDVGVALHYQPINLNDLVAQVAQVVQTSEVAIQFSLDPLLPAVQVDASWLQVSFRYLIDNALRYTPDGGTVTIRTGQQANDVVIEIADTGIGIDAEALPHIFQRFWRQDEAHTTPGFGLGLPIAQKIVELHGGSIEVESVPDQGSSFRVRLPLNLPP